MMKMMKKIVMPLATGVLLTVGAQAQTAKIAIEGVAYVINDTAPASVAGGNFNYEWYRNDTLIPSCTTAVCTVPAELCTGYNVQFKRRVVTVDCVGDSEGWSNTVTITFKCGGGHGTKIAGLCWADRNVGQAGAFGSPHNIYNTYYYYQWNKTKAWADGENAVGWPEADISETWTVVPHPCPTGWRLPTPAEFSALVNSGSTWVNGGAKGNIQYAGRFYGPNHASCTIPNNMYNCIFLPALGTYSGTTPPYSRNTLGSYWCGTTTYGGPYAGDYLSFNSSSNMTTDDMGWKNQGMSLRCVQDVVQ